MNPKRFTLLMLAGTGSILSDAGHSLTDAGDKLARWAIRSLPAEHPAELSNSEIDEAAA